MMRRLLLRRPRVKELPDAGAEQLRSAVLRSRPAKRRLLGARPAPGSSHSTHVARSTSDLRHGAHHPAAAKPLPLGPLIAVIITGPQTIISSGGSANSANSTHQLVRAARTTTPATAAAATINAPIIRPDEIRGGQPKLLGSILADSASGLDSLVNTVTTGTPGSAVLLGARSRSVPPATPCADQRAA